MSSTRTDPLWARAALRLARLGRNVLEDARWGGLLGGARRSRFRDDGAADTVNSDYGTLAAIVDPLVREGDVLVDVGCGKGRVLNYWLSLDRARRIVGLELDADVAASTRRRLRAHRSVQIVAGDAITELPPDATLLFLYNPFDARTVRRFADRAATLDRGRSDLRIVYANPMHLDVLERDPRFRVERREVRVPLSGRRAAWALVTMRAGQ